MIRKFLLKSVAGPFLGTVAAKIGEAVGDLIAYRINPPEPENAENGPLGPEVVEDESPPT